MNGNAAKTTNTLERVLKQQGAGSSDLAAGLASTRRISDYLDHQSRKSASFFEGEGGFKDLSQIAQELKSSQACLEQAIATAHLAQMDDYDMPPLPMDWIARH